MNKFEKFGLGQDIVKAIIGMGFTEPTQIQEETIPLIAKGKDVVGESATGSGKTLAFGCGIVQGCKAGKGIQALVLTPTRELAEQVTGELKKLSYHKKLKLVSVYGGIAIGPQIHSLTKSEIVVATPGRLLDHLERGTINLSKVKVLVMDEADRMFDMGFIDDVQKIISACPKERHTLFFSATITERVKDLAKRHMKDFTIVSAKVYVDPSKLKQVYYDVTKNIKLGLLIHLLKEERDGLVMVFCNTRMTTDFVAKNLKANGIHAIPIHGGLTQNKRTNTLKMFNGAKVAVLVCTDVAARGLHIDNVSHIYNYDLPKDSKDYVHRIGRTARAGEKGMAVNLLSNLDHDNFGRIQREYRNFTIEKKDTPQVERIEFVSNMRSSRPQRHYQKFKRPPRRR